MTALIAGSRMKELLRETSCMAEALWWGTLTDLGVLRERIVVVHLPQDEDLGIAQVAWDQEGHDLAPAIGQDLISLDHENGTVHSLLS
jgi:hypothetical protein